MIVKILGSGQTDTAIKGGKLERTPSSVLIDNELLIDATNYIDSQLTSKNKIKAILITHAHSDCILGLKKISKYINKSVRCYALAHTIKWLKKRIGTPASLRYVELKELKPVVICNKTVIPIPVEHSVMQSAFDPTVAFLVDDFLYAKDIDYDYFYSQRSLILKKQIKQATLTIIDGACFKGIMRGHLNMWDTANYLSKNGYDNIMFTQIAKSNNSHNQLVVELKEINKSYDIAYDGRTFKLKRTSQYLKESTEGIYLADHHAKMIFQKNKTLIVKGKLYNKIIGKVLYVLGSNKSYGVIKIKAVASISLDEFVKYRNKHRLSDKERNVNWKGKQKLFAYTFEIIEKFKQPRLVKITNKNEDVYDLVNFLSEYDIRLNEIVSNLKNYFPLKLSVDDLQIDFKILCLLLKQENIDLKLVEKALCSNVKLILSKELVSFDLSKLTVEQITSVKLAISKYRTDKIYHNKNHNLKLPDVVVVKEVISLKGDEIIINSKKLSDNLLLKSKKIFPNLNLTNESTNKSVAIPLYDLMLIRRDGFIFENETQQIKLFEPFEIMHPGKTFKLAEDAVKYLFKRRI